MKVSRRHFLLGTVSALAIREINPAEAFWHGSAGSSIGKSVLNANFGADQFLNLMKGFGFGFSGTMTPANLNSDQYPSGTIPNNYAGNSGSAGIDTTYFGHYRITWTGASVAHPAAYGGPSIIYDGGTFVGLGGNTGTVQSDMSVTATNPNIEFASGAFITGVGTNGGLVQFTVTTSYLVNITDGTHVKLNNLSGLPTGPNSDGSWTINKIDNQTFTLAGSSAFAGSVTINTSGTVGVNTEVIFSVGQYNFTFIGNGVTNHTLSNLIFCRSADLAAINAGQQISAAAINAIKAIKPRYIRFMDAQAVQNLLANYANKAPVTSMTWAPTRWDANCYGGTTTHSGDVYTTASNPTNSPATGGPVDGETVQVTFNFTNTTTKPTLAVNRSGFGSAVPILDFNMRNLTLTLTGSPTTGDVLTFVFSNSNFSGGTHTFNYTVLAGDTSIDVLGSHLQAALANDLAFAQIGIFFTNGGSGFVSANCATPTTATFSASGAATEACVPGTFGSAGSLVNGAAGTFIYNGVLQAWVFVNGPLASGVPLEYIYEMCTRSNVGAWFCLNIISTSAAATSFGTALGANLPNLPVVCELSNEVWNFNSFPVYHAIAMGVATGMAANSYNDFYALRTAQLLPTFASGFTSGGGTRSNLELVTASVVIEGSGGFSGNMVPLRWNGGYLASAPQVVSGSISGTALTLPVGQYPLIRVGMQVTGTAVSAGTVVTSITGNNTFTVNNSQSVSTTSLTFTNALYATKSGVGGVSNSTAYNAFPTRPIDLMDGTSYATYVQGAQAQNGSGSWSGTQSWYNTLFQASADYASGTPSLMAGAITAWSNDIRDGTLNGVRRSLGMSSYLGSTNATDGSNFIPGWEAKVAVYDGARPGGKSNLTVRCYEGSVPEQAMGANSSAGINSSSSADLTSQFNNNGWTLSPTYGASNAVVAANLVTLALAYKNDPQLAADQLYFWNQQKVVHATRPFSPGQYGIENGTGSTWALYPGTLSSTPWQNFNGQATYNRQ